MPKRTDIKSILVIGAGPIVIGQACEFDYSGSQACKVLREEGYRVILVNSNPATIMTDPEFADATYIEPLTLECMEKIISNVLLGSFMSFASPTIKLPFKLFFLKIFLATSNTVFDESSNVQS